MSVSAQNPVSAAAVPTAPGDILAGAFQSYSLGLKALTLLYDLPPERRREGVREGIAKVVENLTNASAALAALSDRLEHLRAERRRLHGCVSKIRDLKDAANRCREDVADLLRILSDPKVTEQGVLPREGAARAEIAAIQVTAAENFKSAAKKAQMLVEPAKQAANAA